MTKLKFRGILFTTILNMPYVLKMNIAFSHLIRTKPNQTNKQRVDNTRSHSRKEKTRRVFERLETFSRWVLE